MRSADRFLRWTLMRRGEGNDLERLPAAWWEAMLAMLRSILREIDSGTGERELGEGAMAGILCPVRWMYGDRSVRTFEKAGQGATATRCARSHVT